MTTQNRAQLTARKLHRRVGWIAAVAGLAWASSGFLHPILSWTAPRPAVQAAPDGAAESAGLAAPGPLFTRAGVAQVTHVRLLPGQVWLAATPDGARHALDARTGASAPEAERARAVLLARHYAGLPDAGVVSATRVTAFSDRYPSVNRLLPVWEVRLDAPRGLTLYVDPLADRLAMVSDDRRRVLLAVFQHLHTLKFLEPVEPLRIAAILVLVGAFLTATLAGASMLLARHRRRGARRWHSLAAFAAVAPALAFASSGLFHLVVATPFVAPSPPPVATFAVADLADLPRMSAATYDLSASRSADGRALWRAGLADGRGLYFDGGGALAPFDDGRRAQALAGREGPTRVVSRFEADYGFVNKRLPVTAVGEGADAVFVDLREGLVAARAVHGVARAERWSFDVIHKWEPLADAIGRRARDFVTMVAAAVVAAAALLGLWLMMTARRDA